MTYLNFRPPFWRRVYSSRARDLQAKAKQAELEARIAQLDNAEAARKEAERARLRADFAAAVAISKVYEDAIKEDEEQYLGSDDPGDDPECYHWPASHGLHPQETFVKEEHSNLRAHDEELLTPPHAADPTASRTRERYVKCRGTRIFLCNQTLAARHC